MNKRQGQRVGYRMYGQGYDPKDIRCGVIVSVHEDFRYYRVRNDASGLVVNVLDTHII